MAAYAASKTVDRDGWIRVQKKTFTRWANNHLKTRGMEIADLCEDVRSGVLLLNLLEIIGGESIKQVLNAKFNKKPKMKIHMLENCNRVIEYCSAKGVEFVNVGANDFVDGNERIILGFLWKVILRFVVSEDGQQGLLLWCQRSTKPYDNIKIKNFHRSWNDGLGFVGVIHKYRPDLIADPSTLDPENAADNCELAFSVAEEKLGISRLLDVEDVAGNVKPDDKSIATYMNEFYQLFATQMQADHYIDAIVKACAVTRRHDNMISLYNATASSLTSFLADKQAHFDGFEYGRTTGAIRDQLMAFYEYRNGDKPPMAGRVIEASGTLSSLRSSCKSNMRPVFEAADELKPEAIETGWAALEGKENTHEAKLRELYLKFQEVDFAAQKFNARADKFEKWAADRSEVFEEADFGSGVVGCEICANSFEIYEGQLVKFKDAVAEMGNVADVCEATPAHASTEAVVARNVAVQEKLVALEAKGAAYKAQLDETSAKEARRAELEKMVAKEGAIALYDAEDLEERIAEPIVAGQVTAVREKLADLEGPMKDDMEAWVSDVGALREHMDELSKIDQVPASEGASLKRASTMGMNSAILKLISGEDARLTGLREARVTEMKTLLGDEEAREAARRAFADAAAAVGNDLAGKTKELATLDGEPEAQIEALEALSQAHLGATTMEPAEAASKQCEDLAVVINPYTPETIFTLRSQWDEVGKAYKQARNIAEKAILDKAGMELTPEQIAEIREVFDYFDEDKDGALTLKEFQDGCQGMGVVQDADTLEAQYQKIGSGKPLSFDQFSAFMVDQMKTGTSLDDVIAAFRSLASGDSISEDAVGQHFGAREDYADYLLANMPGAEDGNRDFVAFTHQLFTR